MYYICLRHDPSQSNRITEGGGKSPVKESPYKSWILVEICFASVQDGAA
jgi:hypothetical protein